MLVHRLRVQEMSTRHKKCKWKLQKQLTEVTFDCSLVKHVRWKTNKILAWIAIIELERKHCQHLVPLVQVEEWFLNSIPSVTDKKSMIQYDSVIFEVRIWVWRWESMMFYTGFHVISRRSWLYNIVCECMPSSNLVWLDVEWNRDGPEPLGFW